MTETQTKLLFHRSPTAIRLVHQHAHAPTPVEETPEPTTTTADDKKLAEQLAYLQQLLNDVGAAVEELQVQQSDTATEMQVATIELAIVAASWIVGAAIERDMFAIDDLVQSMVEQLYREQPIRVFLNTDDAALLSGLKASSDAAAFADAEVEFVPDAELARGIVRAESARSVLVTDMDDRLADIRRIWMENLNETQNERRADDPAGRGFRRFPERRHSA